MMILIGGYSEKFIYVFTAIMSPLHINPPVCSSAIHCAFVPIGVRRRTFNHFSIRVI